MQQTHSNDYRMKKKQGMMEAGEEEDEGEEKEKQKWVVWQM